MLKINEIFYSIQGESSLVGCPTVFVRTSGCHLRCHYCDTQYAYFDGQKQTLSDVIEDIQTYHTQRVCLTGGEPLLQKEATDLVSQLCDLGYAVSIETSGDLDCHAVDPRAKLVIDVKTPDSGECGRFDHRNLELDNRDIEFKFVICSEKDFAWSEEFAKSNNLFAKSPVLYSPSYGQVSERWLAEKILTTASKARFQMQLHKYLWPDQERGV